MVEVLRLERLYGSDPRLEIIPKRLESIKRIIAIMSSKGGVGKTLVATTASLILADKKYRTGLLDLDFTNPSTHIVLGINPLEMQPVEEKGVIPPKVHGVEYMSIAIYSGDKPLPLRGESIDEVFREILAITRWGNLDYLLIDTPPGLGDEHLNLLTYIGERVEIVIITTPSPLAVRSVDRLLEILWDGRYRVIGLIENMGRGVLKQYCREKGVEYLGNILFDEDLERSLGDIEKLRETMFWENLSSIVTNIISKGS